MFASTETVVCHVCRNLSDRVIEERSIHSGGVTTIVPPGPCGECGAPPTALSAWISGDACPRCGEPLVPGGGTVVLWD